MAEFFEYLFSGTDIISYTITSACTSRTVTKLVNINSSITPSVSMYHGGDTVCGGVNVTFLASPINGGSTPAYTWKVNGITTGSGSSFTYLPVNLDMVSVILKSNATCALPDTAISSHLITVLDPLIPVVGINANPGFDIPFAAVDTFIATVINGGISPVFQWMVNNHVVIDAITNTYITDSLHNGDSITCIVTSSGLCSGYSTFNSVGIHVGTEGVSNTNRQFVDVALSPNPNNGEFYLKGNVGNSNEPITIDITDMPGRVIYTKLVLNSKGSINELIQQGQLASGTYLLNIHSPSANKIIRFVVE